MAALNFKIEWPNGEIMECYSPSTIVRQYFKADDTLTIEELIAISTAALDRASERVEERFGFICAAAAEQNDKIICAAAGFESNAVVRIIEIREHIS